MRKMRKNIMMSLVAVNLFIACTQTIQKNTGGIKDTTAHKIPSSKIDTTSIEWVNIGISDSNIIIAMPYADTANFTHTQIYDCPTCLLRPEVAEAIIKASEVIKQKGFRLVMFDCYRPFSYQKKMFDIVKDTRYVASPEKGSKHNSGCAVDLGLADTSGHMLDMGSVFDDFSERSHYKSVNISPVAVTNRALLRSIMLQAGFQPYEKEWWHFNYKACTWPQSDYHWSCH